MVKERCLGGRKGVGGIVDDDLPRWFDEELNKHAATWYQHGGALMDCYYLRRPSTGV
jgi:hypothetical protein